MEDQYDNDFNVGNNQVYMEFIPENGEPRSGIWEDQINVQSWKFSLDNNEKLTIESENKKGDQLDKIDQEISRKKSKGRDTSKIQDKLNVIQISSPKKKRLRRTASEISRNWKCDQCNKSYGSEGALKTHRKLKHPGQKNPKGTQSNREMMPFSIPKSISSIGLRGTNTQIISVPIEKAEYGNTLISDNQHYGLPPDHGLYVSDDKFKFKMSPMPYSNQFVYNHLPHQKFDYKYYHEYTGKISNEYIPSMEYDHSYNPSMYSLPMSTPIHNKPDESEIDHLAYVPILMMKIGEYIKTSNICGDLICCISFKERKFYWELLLAQSLSRIEIDFDNISALEIQPRSDGITVMILQLSHPPKFWNGWKSHYQIQWIPMADFTTGYAASIYRHHVLHFVKSAISFPLHRLFEQEIRLKNISEMGIKHENLFFDEIRDPNFETYNNDVLPIHK